MKSFTLIVTSTVLLTLIDSTNACTADPIEMHDVIVYGGTPAGVAAAVEAGKSNTRVLLIESSSHVGGMLTNGLSHADFRTFEAITGSYRELTRRVASHYDTVYGSESPQANGNFRGTHAEPSVNQAVMEAWLNECPNVKILTNASLRSVRVEFTPSDDVPNRMRTIHAAHFVSTTDGPLFVGAKTWIDATYEGDLMAAAGCRYEVGQEGRDQYDESLAPETADRHLQGYNFRFVVTDQSANQIPTPRPTRYRRDEFLPLLKLIDAGTIDKPFCKDSGDPKALFKAQAPSLPNSKFDVNDVSHGRVRLSLPRINDEWAEGDLATRQQIWEEHRSHQVGLLHFVQNDPEVPAWFRELANEFRLCRDEFVDSDGLPEQLYVREARRMVGRHVFTQHDTACVDGLRSRLQGDAIALGDYGPNCHGVWHEGPRIGGTHTGEFYKPCPPYQIPIGVLQPVEVDNLLVPVACSASHVGFCALRLEPIWMSLGQASGIAARLAMLEDKPVVDIDAVSIRRVLHSSKAATTYISDVDEDDPDFVLVQTWAALGGFHGEASEQDAKLPCGQRGTNIVGQYYEAFPGHAANLDDAIDQGTRQRWETLARQHDLGVKRDVSDITRRDWIRSHVNLNQD